MELLRERWGYDLGMCIIYTLVLGPAPYVQQRWVGMAWDKDSSPNDKIQFQSPAKAISGRNVVLTILLKWSIVIKIKKWGYPSSFMELVLKRTCMCMCHSFILYILLENFGHGRKQHEMLHGMQLKNSWNSLTLRLGSIDQIGHASQPWN